MLVDSTAIVNWRIFIQTALPTMDRAKVRILRFKNLPPFRHYRGLQNHV